MILQGLLGTIGGMTRAFVGLLKYYQENKKKKFRWSYILFTIIASGFIGMFCGLIVQDNTLSLLAGYAGTDFIENIYKIRKKQRIII